MLSDGTYLTLTPSTIQVTTSVTLMKMLRESHCRALEYASMSQPSIFPRCFKIIFLPLLVC